MLTKSERATIEDLAKATGEINLYQETSSSGKSETLRYSRRWVEIGRWGLQERHNSGMVLSVKVNQVRGGKYGPNWIDDPKDVEKFNQKAEEAKQLFKQLKGQATQVARVK